MKRAKPPSVDPPRRPRDRKLTSEEETLWSYVAASIAPEKKAKPRVRRRGEAAETSTPDTEADAPPTLGAARKPEGAASRRPTAAADKPLMSPPPPPLPPAKRQAPPLAEFDRRKVRHIARGKVEIDARLDLHGLRQGEARYRLVGFLHAAQSRGHRTVLVITGKGATTPVDPLANALGEPQRGVLRRLVPQWLGEPDLRTLVVSFTTATLRHGGDGALYVHLRRG